MEKYKICKNVYKVRRFDKRSVKYKDFGVKFGDFMMSNLETFLL